MVPQERRDAIMKKLAGLAPIDILAAAIVAVTITVALL